MNDPRSKELEDQSATGQQDNPALNHMADILERMSDAFLVLDQNWIIRRINRAYEQVIGLNRDEVMGQCIWDLYPEIVGTLFQSEYKRAFETQQEVQFEAFYSPLEAWYSCRVFPTQEGVSVYFRDITATKRAEILRRGLLMRLVTAHEDERQRLARELHDQTGQDLAALMVGLKRLSRQQELSLEGVFCIQQLEGILDHLTLQTRRVTLDLRSDLLRLKGIEEALAQYIEDWGHVHKIEVDFHSRGFKESRPAPYIETTLYRVVQEALTNVLNHAHAQRVGVVLEHRGDHILLIIEDDGDGFDVETTLVQSISEGRLGIKGMIERSALVEGSFHIESSPEGTTLFMRTPLN